jgi:N-acetylglucosamine kinase-like BadF-type ATPase
LEGRPGIVQILGTGSSCYGRNALGADWLAGGRGHLISDEGSGNWMGLHAMRAAVRAYDGRDPATPLLGDVLAVLGIESIEEILHRIYVVGLSRAEMATLGPLVVQRAMEGDPAARQIVDRGAFETAECVAAVARRLGMTDGPCAVCAVGGMLQAGPIVAERFAAEVVRLLPTAMVRPATLPPVLGAAILAMELAGVEVTPGVREQLRAGRECV